MRHSSSLTGLPAACGGFNRAKARRFGPTDGYTAPGHMGGEGGGGK